MAKSKIGQFRQLGCGFLLITGLFLIALLWLNSVFVRLFFAHNLAQIDERVFNAAQFMLPLVLLFIEFWVYDAIRDFFRFRNQDFD